MTTANTQTPAGPPVRSEALLDDLLSRVIALHAELGDQANQRELSENVRGHLFGQRLALRTVREWIEKLSTSNTVGEGRGTPRTSQPLGSQEDHT